MDKIQEQCKELKDYKYKKRDSIVWITIIIVMFIVMIIGCFVYAFKGEADHEISKQLTTHANCEALTSNSLKQITQEECDRAAVYSRGSALRNYCSYTLYTLEDYFEGRLIFNPMTWIYTAFSFSFYWLLSTLFHFSLRTMLFGAFRRLFLGV